MNATYQFRFIPLFILPELYRIKLRHWSKNGNERFETDIYLISNICIIFLSRDNGYFELLIPFLAKTNKLRAANYMI